MRISVALATYNGERFLAEQLASIREQSRLPDEVVICDDASTDGTAAILREFCDRMPFRTILEIGESNRGSTPTFTRAIELCSGDVITLADQDDVWLPNKLAKLDETLSRDPKAGFAFSDATVVNEVGRPAGYTLWQAIEFGRAEQLRFANGEAFECLLRRYRVTGATLAFRSQYRSLILPIPPEWVHDAWIALLISATAPAAVIAEPLIRYRKHAAQQHGADQRGFLDEYRTAGQATRETFDRVVACYSAALDRLRDAPGVAPDRCTLLEQKLNHARRRAAMRSPGTWRLPAILSELRRGHYRRFSRGWKSALQDLLMP